MVKRGTFWIIVITVLILLTLVMVFIFEVNSRKNDLSDGLNSRGNVSLANPASVNCVEHNGTLVMMSDTQGNQYALCKFSNGKECEEWAFFRGECTNE